MEALKVLEQKLSLLVDIVGKLKEEKKQLKLDGEAFKVENLELKNENSRLAEEGAQLSAKLEAVSTKALDGKEQFNKLDKEKKHTKAMVDDLIKSIELLEKENQL